MCQAQLEYGGKLQSTRPPTTPEYQNLQERPDIPPQNNLFFRSKNTALTLTSVQLMSHLKEISPSAKGVTPYFTKCKKNILIQSYPTMNGQTDVHTSQKMK